MFIVLVILEVSLRRVDSAWLVALQAHMHAVSLAEVFVHVFCDGCVVV